MVAKPAFPGLSQDIVYPGLNVKWYHSMESHPSVFEDTGELGIQPPTPTVVAVSVAEEPAPAEFGSVAVSVFAVRGLRVPANLRDTAQSYRIAVFYQSDRGNLQVFESRKGEVKKATCSGPKNRQECIFDDRYLMPFDHREQFVMIALYRVGQQIDTLVGEVAVPLADPDVCEALSYTLMRDFEEQGEITLSVHMLPPSGVDTPKSVFSSDLVPAPRGMSDSSSELIPAPRGISDSSSELIPAPREGFYGLTSTSSSSLGSYLDPATAGIEAEEGDVVTLAELKNLKVTAWNPEEAYLERRRSGDVGDTLDSLSRSANMWMRRLMMPASQASPDANMSEDPENYNSNKTLPMAAGEFQRFVLCHLC